MKRGEGGRRNGARRSCKVCSVMGMEQNKGKKKEIPAHDAVSATAKDPQKGAGEKWVDRRGPNEKKVMTGGKTMGGKNRRATVWIHFTGVRPIQRTQVEK